MIRYSVISAVSTVVVGCSGHFEITDCLWMLNVEECERKDLMCFEIAVPIFFWIRTKLSAYTTRLWTAVEPGTFRKTFKRVVTVPPYRRCLDFLNEMSYGAAEQIRELCAFRTGHNVHFVVFHHSLSHPYSHCLICPLGQSIAS
jgi:hypothetical protein